MVASVLATAHSDLVVLTSGHAAPDLNSSWTARRKDQPRLTSRRAPGHAELWLVPWRGPYARAHGESRESYLLGVESTTPEKVPKWYDVLRLLQ
ncbi:hypothetical protein NDU88_006001 [Pleurodeles waltl]|uniref:Uncharacterized protein n=1 Tax=Pleurodeles waltl TaxID=8319 RepID=A0AAV7ULK0_PLEWA|nr:hypothetical protein NDU88_006001 [Pleurodeles waltl]